MIELKKLLQAIEVIDIRNEKEIPIAGISFHSDRATEGGLFVCVTGYKTDGHKYLGKAVEKGAAAAVVERFVDGFDIPQIKVANSRIALARLGAAFYGHPADHMTMIGITATNGKTTTSYMTNAMLENHGFRTGLIGTVVIKIDDTTVPAQLTTPESLDLQEYLWRMESKGVSHVTMEVSSAALETHRVETVKYDIVAFNNLSREHIDSHGSFERYFEAKSSLIRNADKSAVAVLNLDDEYSASLADRTEAQVVTFGVRSRDGHFGCQDLDLSTGRAKFKFVVQKAFQARDLEFEPGEFDVELSVPGLHSVYNSMVAIIGALLCGVSVPVIQRTLRTFPGVERRFQFIHEGDDFSIIDDHFANPGNINVTMETLKFMDYEKLHLVYAIRGERGPTVNRENAEAIAEWMARLELDELIATKSVSHVTSKDRVTDEEERAFLGVMNEAGIRVRMHDELPDAIAEAIAKAGRGDLVLLGGCQGMDPAAPIALDMLRSGSRHGV